MTNGHVRRRLRQLWARGVWEARATGFTILSNYTVTLYNYNADHADVVAGTVAGGSGNAAGVAARPGQHALGRRLSRLHPQPAIEPGSIDTRIFDIYGNQLDGENLGNQTQQSRAPNSRRFPEYSRPAIRRYVTA